MTSIPFSLRQIEYFCAVAQAGSIAAAAEAQFVSRSALASAINDLEETLAAKLFVRHRAQGTTLTPAGKELLEKSLILLNNADAILGLNTATSELSGELNVGCYPSLAPTVLGHMWRACALRYPGLSVVPVSAELDDLLRRLKSGELDLIISFGFETEPGLETLDLYSTVMHAVLPADHHLADAPSVRASDLIHEELLLMNLSPARQLTLDYFSELGLIPKMGHAIDNYELIRSLVALGAGYSIAAQRPSGDKSYQGESLVARPIHPAPSELPVTIGWMKGRNLSRSARAFAQLASQESDRFVHASQTTSTTV